MRLLLSLARPANSSDVHVTVARTAALCTLLSLARAGLASPGCLRDHVMFSVDVEFSAYRAEKSTVTENTTSQYSI